MVPRGVDEVVLNEHHVVTGNDGICPTFTSPLQVLTFPDTEVGDMQLFAKQLRLSLLVDNK